MFVIDTLTLRGVDLLDLTDDIAMKRLAIERGIEFLQIDMAFGKCRAVTDQIPYLHLNTDIPRYGVFEHALILRFDEDRIHFLFVIFLDFRHHSIGFSHQRLTLRSTRFENFLDARESLRDIGSGDTSGMEGTHSELRTRFTDGLSSHHTDGRSEGDDMTTSEIDTITALADAATSLTGDNRSHFHLLQSRFFASFRLNTGDKIIFLDNGFSFYLKILDGHATLHAGSERDTDRIRIFTIEIGTFRILAVYFANDDILRHIDETTSEVSGCRGTKCGIGISLTRTMVRDEIFEHIESFLERTPDRKLDRFTGRTRHESLHTRHLHDD